MHISIAFELNVGSASAGIICSCGIGYLGYVIFKIKDQSGYIIHKSYFGWMYKEKNQLESAPVIAELTKVETIIKNEKILQFIRISVIMQSWIWDLSRRFFSK